ncbi:GDSL-type esterase/lipase family protein [Longirhabdus pacifica]|uniref:GDSL-type esterase/lipase family protein n=1 Tax=Longirhabdus pacifica TaxID=2305227 RepID=UPI0013E8CDBF|nr:GDSL-type esterase/lipase family protein [Longirhabdus pacifica]
MHQKNGIWRLLFITSVVTVVLLIVGFGYAASSVLFPPSGGVVVTEPEEEIVEPGTIRLIAIGDSITNGFGDESGNGGYASIVRDALKEEEDIEQVVFANFAIDGYTTVDVLSDLNEKEGIKDEVKKADMILMTIGANDLLPTSEEVNLEVVSGRRAEVLNNLQSIFTLIREYNSEAQIVYTGLYNPFVEIDMDKQISIEIDSWNSDVFKLATTFDNILVVRPDNLFHGDEFFAFDNYHPSFLGHERIAERIMQAIR